MKGFTTKKYHLMLVLLLSMLALPSFAQKNKITAEADYVANDDDSKNQAKKKALEKAILKGLAEKYGTYMSQEASVVVDNDNGQSNVKAHHLTNSMVKGENLGIIGQPIYSEFHENGMDVYRVKVTFWARERTSATVDFNAKVLKKGTDDSFEASEFKNGDDMYLSFSTPKKGYVAVYLVEEDYAYCMLPYRSQTDGIYQVDANKRYVFFSAKDEQNSNSSIVDEYAMGTDKDVIENTIWVLFSPNEFSKANDAESGRRIDVGIAGIEGLPRELPYKEFLKWKSGLQAVDKKMTVKPIKITIKK